MDFVASTFFLACIAFTGANVTDLFVLVFFFSKERFKTREIVVGQYIGVGGLIVVCLAAAIFGTSFIPSEWVRFLGIIPILVGVKNILNKESNKEKIPSGKSGRILNAHILEVASVAFADCSDNLAIFIPLLIKNDSAEKVITAITFLILIGVWCAVAYYMTHHKRIGSFVRYYGQILAPFILIGLGIVILFS